MSGLYLNRTDEYHRRELDSLCWEVTISIMLEDPVCRSVLRRPGSFGDLLCSHLFTLIPMDRVHHVLEVGGGYGYLMRDLLRHSRGLKATMIEISPALLARQREVLEGLSVRFLLEDFLQVDTFILSGIDLAMLNEVMGDLPTACRSASAEPSEQLEGEVERLCTTYGLSFGQTLNIGAIQAVEKLCAARIPFIYLSEQSCEASTPEELEGLIDLKATGEPERIRLHGHEEYTVRFSDIERVALAHGYGVRRGRYLDFIQPAIDGEVAFILQVTTKDERHERIRQLIEDLARYEYLVLTSRN